MVEILILICSSICFVITESSIKKVNVDTLDDPVEDFIRYRIWIYLTGMLHYLSVM